MGPNIGPVQGFFMYRTYIVEQETILDHLLPEYQSVTASWQFPLADDMPKNHYPILQNNKKALKRVQRQPRLLCERTHLQAVPVGLESPESLSSRLPTCDRKYT